MRALGPAEHGTPTGSPERDGSVVVIDPGAVWLALGVVVVAVLVWVLVTHALDTLVLLFIAITFGEGIRPLVDMLERHRLPRPLAVLGIYVLLAVATLGLLWVLLRPLSSQVLDFSTNLPSYLQRAEGLFAQLRLLASRSPEAQQAIEALPNQISGLGSGLAVLLLATPLLALDALFKFIELYLMAFFWLTATQALKPFVVGLFPPRVRAEASDVIGELGHKVGGHTRAVAINMVVIACLSAVGLLVLGIPYPLLLAFVAGLAETLPLLGPWLAGAFAVAVTLLTGGVVQAGEVVGLYLLIHLIEGNTLVPYVTYRITELNPLVTIVAISAGGAMLGLVGAVLGVPMALVLQVLVLRVLAPGLRHLAGVATREELRHPAGP
jgi:putative heme transporter